MNRAFAHLNYKIYAPMQGPSELGASGKLVDWDRTADLAKIAVPTLVLVGRLDAEEIQVVDEQLAERIPGARLQWLDGVAHVPHLENDPATLDAIEAFVGSVS